MLTAKLNNIVSEKNGFFSDTRNVVSLGAAFLINIIHILLLYLKFGLSDATILIHYNVVYGPDAVQKATFAYIIPLTALIFLIVNFFLARVYYRKEKLAAYFINFSNIAIQLIFLTVGIIISRINE